MAGSAVRDKRRSSSPGRAVYCGSCLDRRPGDQDDHRFTEVDEVEVVDEVVAVLATELEVVWRETDQVAVVDLSLGGKIWARRGVQRQSRRWMWRWSSTSPDKHLLTHEFPSSSDHCECSCVGVCVGDVAKL